MKKKPNILFILMDHYLYHRHGVDGTPSIQTPNLDRLCQEGTCFERCYSSNPLCGPTRRSLLTGLYSHHHGEVLNDVNVPFPHKTYLEQLTEEGYQNYYYGKWHAGPGTAHDHGCEGYCYPSYGNAYQTPEYRAYLERRNLDFPTVRIEHCMIPVNRTTNMVEGADYIQDKAWSSESASGILQGDKMTHQAMFLANLVCDKLETLDPNSDKPFSMRVDFWEPHAPYFVPQQYADMYPPKDIPRYPSFDSDLKGKPACYFYENHPGCCDKNFRILQPNPLPWETTWAEMLSRCYGQITLVDEAMGMILDKLKALHLDEDTLIIMTADHGDGLACHGGHFDKASYLAEEVLRVPLVVRYPGIVPQGVVSQSLVGNIDVPATIVDAAGITMEHPLDGTSLLELCRNQFTTQRTAMYAEGYGHKFPNVAKALIKEQYKYIENLDDLSELYDLEADPYELTNLALNATYAQLVAQLHQELVQWVDAEKDPFYTMDATQQIAHFKAMGRPEPASR